MTISEKKGWDKTVVAKVGNVKVREQEKRLFNLLSQGVKLETASVILNHQPRWASGIVAKYILDLDLPNVTAIVALLIRKGII